MASGWAPSRRRELVSDREVSDTAHRSARVSGCARLLPWSPICPRVNIVDDGIHSRSSSGSRRDSGPPLYSTRTPTTTVSGAVPGFVSESMISTVRFSADGAADRTPTDAQLPTASATANAAVRCIFEKEAITHLVAGCERERRKPGSHHTVLPRHRTAPDRSAGPAATGGSGIWVGRLSARLRDDVRCRADADPFLPATPRRCWALVSLWIPWPAGELSWPAGGPRAQRSRRTT